MNILNLFLEHVKLGRHLLEFEDFDLEFLGDAEPKDLLDELKTGDTRIDSKVSSIPAPKEITPTAYNVWMYKFFNAMRNNYIQKIMIDMFNVPEVKHGEISTLGDNWGRSPINKAGAKILLNMFRWYKESDKNRSQFKMMVGNFPDEVRNAIKSSIKDYKPQLMKDSDSVKGLASAGDGSDVDMFMHLLTNTSKWKFDPKNEGFLYEHIESLKHAFVVRSLFC